MPLVVVLDSNGFSVEDVLGPWCATCYDACWCAACSECVVLTCRVVRGRLFRAKNNTVWFTCHQNAGTQQLFRQVRSLYTTEAPNVWCTLECVS